MKIQHSFSENLYTITFSTPLNIRGIIKVDDNNQIEGIFPSNVSELVVECSTMGGSFSYGWMDDILELFDNVYLALESKADAIRAVEDFMTIVGVKDLDMRTIIPVIRNIITRHISNEQSDLNILSIKLLS